MRNALAIALTMALTVTGALVALDLAILVAPESSMPAPDSPDLAADSSSIVRAFYTVANELAAGEDAPLLSRVLSPMVAMHSAARDVRGSDAIAARFARLRRSGATRIAVTAIVSHGGDVYALVAGYRSGQSGTAGQSNLTLPLWQTIDRFRIERGAIIDYWPGPVAVSPPAPAPTVTLRALPGRAAASLARLEVAPGAAVTAFLAPYPQLLLVESGALSVSRRSGATLARAGDARVAALPAARGEDDLVLTPGDILAPREGVGTTIRNTGATPASALSLLLAPSHHAPTSEVFTVVGMHDPARIGRRVDWPGGLASTELAVAALPGAVWATPSIEVSETRLSLEPGAQVPPLASGGVTLAIVTSGILSVTHAATPARSAATPGPDDRLVRAGEAIALASGTAPILVNGGATTLELQIVDVHAAPGAATPAAR